MIHKNLQKKPFFLGFLQPNPATTDGLILLAKGTELIKHLRIKKLT
jgi:hypothetical protein